MVHRWFSAQHHPSEVGRLSRKREGHRTAIVSVDDESEGGDPVERVQIIIPVESIDERPGMRLTSLKRWFAPVGVWPASGLDGAPSGASLVIDPYQFTLFVGTGGDAWEVTGTHDGQRFCDLASGDSADVYLTADLDVRRAKPDEFAAACRSGNVVGARIPAFGVHTL